ncbi:MAG: chemotaxis protein CheA [Spirochaetales bacterium]|nr:chemotaxis protein CheA [Spirochaetales bacterium]
MRWQVEVDLEKDLVFPDVVGVQLYQIFSTATSDQALAIKPDPFSGTAQAAHRYELTFSFTPEAGTAGVRINDVVAQWLVPVNGLANWTVHPAPLAEELSAQPAKSEGVQERQNRKMGQHRNGKSSHIRIGLDKIEQLVDLVGELIISKSQVDTLSHRLHRAELDNSLAVGLDLASNQLDLVIRQLRDLSLSIRMVPLELTLARLPAMVRELARKQEKQVRLLLSGGETELDKVILEALTDPLTHLIRNAIDHGLESAGERLRVGKSVEGHILVEAFYEDDSIKVIVEDDGRGLDLETIKVRALERGLLQKDQINAGEQEILDLIFRPGFSTARSITDISGRGVGMDVVKSNVEKIGGSVQVESQVGQGTRITLKIPLTLSIVDALLVKDQDQVFALPLLSIGKVSRIHKTDIQTVGQSLLVNLVSYSIPAYPIAGLFGRPEKELPSELFLIETALQDGRSGIIAEQVLGQQEIVIKSLGTYLGSVAGISGGTILGDGRVALIIDVKSSLKQMHRQREQREAV